MSDFGWRLADRNAVAVGTGTQTFPYTLELTDSGANSLPWPSGLFPALLILGIGFTLSTDANAATRRPRLTITQPGGSFSNYPASGTQTAGLLRRWEFWVGMSLETTLTTTLYREVIPDGLVLLPNTGSLTIDVDNKQAGDGWDGLVVSGRLLFGDET